MLASGRRDQSAIGFEAANQSQRGQRPQYLGRQRKGAADARVIVEHVIRDQRDDRRAAAEADDIEDEQARLIGWTSSGRMPRSRKFTHKTTANTNTAYQARPRDGHGCSTCAVLLDRSGTTRALRDS